MSYWPQALLSWGIWDCSPRESNRYAETIAAHLICLFDDSAALITQTESRLPADDFQMQMVRLRGVGAWAENGRELVTHTRAHRTLERFSESATSLP